MIEWWKQMKYVFDIVIVEWKKEREKVKKKKRSLMVEEYYLKNIWEMIQWYIY